MCTSMTGIYTPFAFKVLHHARLDKLEIQLQRKGMQITAAQHSPRVSNGLTDGCTVKQAAPTKAFFKR